MRAATEFIGHPAIRNRGTVGGSVAHADPAAELPVLLQVLDAEIELCSTGSRRTIPADDFFMGLLMTGMEPDELLTGVSLPLPGKSAGWGFHEVARRHGDFALVAAAALITLDGRGAVASAAVALGGIAERPVRVNTVEDALMGNALTPGRDRICFTAGRGLGHARGRHPRRRGLPRPSGTGPDPAGHPRRRGARPLQLISSDRSLTSPVEGCRLFWNVQCTQGTGRGKVMAEAIKNKLTHWIKDHAGFWELRHIRGSDPGAVGRPWGVGSGLARQENHGRSYGRRQTARWQD